MKNSVIILSHPDVLTQRDSSGQMHGLEMMRYLITVGSCVTILEEKTRLHNFVHRHGPHAQADGVIHVRKQVLHTTKRPFH